MEKVNASARTIRGIFLLVALVYISVILNQFSPDLLPALDRNRPFIGWRPADIRLISDATFDQTNPEIVAAYIRSAPNQLFLRVDFTEFISFDGQNLAIEFDYLCKNSTCQSLDDSSKSKGYLKLKISGTEEFTITDHHQSNPISTVTIDQDEILKSIIITINNPPAEISTGVGKVNINLYKDANPTPLSTSGWLPIRSTRIHTRAPVIFAFSTSLKTATPAQLLRSWNGAHTGPLGQRHGLEQVLAAVEQFYIPVFLLDITTPDRLAALFLLGQSDRLESLYQNKVVFLPDSVTGPPEYWQQTMEVNQYLQKGLWSHKSASANSPFSSEIPGQYLIAFGKLKNSNYLRKWDNCNIVPLPDPAGMIQASDANTLHWQADQNGLTMPAMAALLKSAHSSETNDLVVFGGNLPETTWADSAVIPQAFYQIENIPWIRVLTESDLITWKAKEFSNNSQIPCENILCHSKFATQIDLPYKLNELEQRLSSVPINNAGLLAWLTYNRLTDASLDDATRLLNASYLDQVDRLITAAHWVENPGNITVCGVGLFDTDCILANNSQILFFNQQDGSLIAGFIQVGDDIHQWTAPFSQRATALSDPSDWIEKDGRQLDPAVQMGSFGLGPNMNQVVSRFSENSLHFSASQSQSEITYRIDSTRLIIELNNPQQIGGSIILAPCPLDLFDTLSTDSATSSCQSNFDCRVEVAGCLKIELSSSGVEFYSLDSYRDSPVFTDPVEDPNKDYPAGHYLPTGYVTINYSTFANGTITIAFPK